MTTSVYLRFGFYAMSLKEDSVISFSDSVLSFSKVGDMKREFVEETQYSTYEKNFWLLDGKYKFAPTDTSDIHIGIISESMSGADGVFEIQPVFTAEFSRLSSLQGLTLNFTDLDYPSSINVTYYDSGGFIIRSDFYAPTSKSFFTNQPVSGFTKMTVAFVSTNQPYRRVRLKSIEYGELIALEGDAIKDAVIVEQIHPLSIELPYNEFEVSLISTDTNFDITNPTGDYFFLQSAQPMDVYEIVDGVTQYMGRFYLNEWENKSDNEVSFRMTDLIGILDSYTFLGGLYSAKPVGELLDEMFGALAIAYEADAAITSQTVTGWIPVCSYREALQLILFRCGGWATMARNSFVQIKAFDLNTPTQKTITKDDKGLQQTLTLKPLVTGIEIVSHDYATVTEAIELFNNTLAVGTHLITFSQPVHDLIVSGGTIFESGHNYAYIQVDIEGAVVLSGQKYLDVTKVNEFKNQTLDSAVKKNVVTIADATLVDNASALGAAERVYDYYQQRYWQKSKIFMPNFAVGTMVEIASLKNKQVKGFAERLTINLAKGFTAQAEIVGDITA